MQHFACICCFGIYPESSESEKGFRISEELNPAMFTPLLKPGGIHRGQQLLKENVIPSILFCWIRGKSIAFSEGTQEDPGEVFVSLQSRSVLLL